MSKSFYKKALLVSASIVVIIIAYAILIYKNDYRPDNNQKEITQLLPDTKYYTFGVVPQYEQRKLFHIWRPILNELEARTNIKIKMMGTPGFHAQLPSG